MGNHILLCALAHASFIDQNQFGSNTFQYLRVQGTLHYDINLRGDQLDRKSVV